MNALRQFLLLPFLLAAAAGLLVAGGTAAQAATPVPTGVEIWTNHTVAVYGTSYRITAWVDVATGGRAASGEGTMTLQSRVSGGAWKDVGTTAQVGGHSWNIKASRTTRYRVRYTGGGSPALAPSTSIVGTVQVLRKLKVKTPHDGSLTLTGTIAPAYTHRSVILQRATCPSGCSWHNQKTVRTNGSSTFKAKLPVLSRRTYFRFKIPGDARFAVTYSTGYIWMTRP